MHLSDGRHITGELRRIQGYVRSLPSMKNMSELDRQHRQVAAKLNGLLSDAQKLANDAAKTDTPDIRRTSLLRCSVCLDEFREALLAASTLGLVDVVDVAHISALADQVNDLVVSEQRQLGPEPR